MYGIVFFNLHCFVDFPVPSGLSASLLENIAALNSNFYDFCLCMIERVSLLLEFGESLARILLIKLIALTKLPSFFDELHFDEWTTNRFKILYFFQSFVH